MTFLRRAMTFRRTAPPFHRTLAVLTETDTRTFAFLIARRTFCGGPVGVVQGGAEGRAAPLADGARRGPNFSTFDPDLGPGQL